VAPSRSSIAQRVDHVLDRTRSRGPARFGWLAIALPAAVALDAGLVVAEPVIPAPLGHGAIADAGEWAAARLARLDGASSRALAAAIESRDWNARRPGGNTNFNEPAAIEPLLLALRDDSPAVRRIALWGLSEMRPTPGSSASGPVSALLDDPAADVRAQAARALGDFGAIEEARRIADLLDDGSADVRREAAHALGDLQAPATRPALERALNDPDPAVRKKAGWALRQVGEAERILKRGG
jgi:HEAT repeat protein